MIFDYYFTRRKVVSVTVTELNIKFAITLSFNADHGLQLKWALRLL